MTSAITAGPLAAMLRDAVCEAAGRRLFPGHRGNRGQVMPANSRSDFFCLGLEYTFQNRRNFSHVKRSQSLPCNRPTPRPGPRACRTRAGARHAPTPAARFSARPATYKARSCVERDDLACTVCFLTRRAGQGSADDGQGLISAGTPPDPSSEVLAPGPVLPG